ncbi:MAG: hypothetical protein IPP30_06785 [Flavobacterium sp.]|nr:hypothetical protein [Flavobacterium sp.]
MRKYYYAFLSMLFLGFGMVSCSNEESKKGNEVASRPTILQNNVVQIGTQLWTTRNLDVSRYRNGDIIPQVTDLVQWATYHRCLVLL